MSSIFQRLTRPFTSATLRLTPDQPAVIIPDNAQVAIVAAGCFWGVEHLYARDFKDKGLLRATVGYIGGNTNDPSYREVCDGQTGHAEALRIIFDPDRVTYRTLLEYFYKMHDPTSENRQGPDEGTQYRSGIFYTTEEQKDIAQDVTRKADSQWWENKIKTEVLPAGSWYDAEVWHQRYLHKNPGGYECPSHFLRKFPPLK